MQMRGCGAGWEGLGGGAGGWKELQPLGKRSWKGLLGVGVRGAKALMKSHSCHTEGLAWAQLKCTKETNVLDISAAALSETRRLPHTRTTHIP